MSEHHAQTLDLSGIPSELVSGVANAWHRVSDLDLPDEQAWLASVPRVWAASEFVARNCSTQPELLRQLFSSTPSQRQLEGLGGRASVLIDSTNDETQLMRALRRFRIQEAVQLAWRDLAGWLELDEVITTMSHLAEQCVQRALNRTYQWFCEQRGTPIGDRSGKPVEMVIFALGKLGGGELNFSSDIDLVFAYSEEGETDSARPISNHEFFTKLGRKLIYVLDQITEDGFCFRVDMRLRPNGESGPLALSFDAMEHYYQTHGRDWERYAWIKARPVAGDFDAGRELLAHLRPFIYRKYLDYGAVTAIQDMKRMIESELANKGMTNNIKLGRGGIREIEFIAQSFQLIRGGRDTRLQNNRLLPVLRSLADIGVLAERTADQLRAAYAFLRNLENRLQMLADQQTHVLPQDAMSRARVALGCGFSDWQKLEEELQQYRDTVHEIFQQTFAPHEPTSPGTIAFKDLWHSELDDQLAQQELHKAGYQNAAESWKHLYDLRYGRDYKALSTTGRERLDRLAPLLIADAAKMENPDDTLQRLIRLVQSIGQRPNYLLLLIDSELARTQLVKLCSASAWIANWVSRTPLLLDELLDPISAEAGASPQQLEQEMRERLAGIDSQDLEFQMDTLRELRHAAVLRVAAADVSGLIDTHEVGRRLSDIAVVTLEQVMHCAMGNLAPRFGRIADDDTQEIPLTIAAYGKLGSQELGYHSDLDIVFLYPSTLKSGSTQGGERSLSNEQYLSRLVQRVVHILTIRTSAGLLYDIDMRLRPSGRAGTLVTTLEAFTGYQSDHAWTWEHQAVVRARAVTGPPEVRDAFEAIRRAVLTQPRDPRQLAQEVRDMRDKMAAANDRSDDRHFDLKQGQGGMVDIEFLVQYYVLRWAHECEALVTPRANLEILATLVEHGILDDGTRQALAQAYELYLATDHRLKLAEQPALVPVNELEAARNAVREIWENEFGLK